MKKDFLIIVNPKAGGGRTAKYLSHIIKVADKSKFSFELLLTTKRGDARKYSAENSDLFENYLVAGGDGTINEVINGFDVARNNLPKLGVLPLGSGNDFGKLMHGKKKIRKIIADYFNGEFNVFQSNLCKAEITDANENVIEFQFINALGIGFDSYVAHENLDSKIFSGLISYVISVVQGLKKFNGVQADVYVDGEKITERKRLLLVTIGNNKTSGGGFYLNPFAEIDDDKLDVTTIEHLPPMKILKNLPLTLVNKTEQVKGFTHHNGTEITVELIEPFIVHADGEIFSTEAKKVYIRLLDKKIELIA